MPSTRGVEDCFRYATGELLISRSAVSEIIDRLWQVPGVLRAGRVRHREEECSVTQAATFTGGSGLDR